MLMIGMCLELCIVQVRDNVFITVEKIHNEDNTITLKHFRPEGYSSSYHLLLSISILFTICPTGFNGYITTHYTRYLVLFIISLIIEFLILFPDITNRFMPFDMKTKNGYTTFAILIIVISIVLSFRIYNMTSRV